MVIASFVDPSKRKEVELEEYPDTDTAIREMSEMAESDDSDTLYTNLYIIRNHDKEILAVGFYRPGGVLVWEHA